MGTAASRGLTIMGRVASVKKEGSNIQVGAKFNVLVDGAFSNVATLDGRASASGGMTAEDALRAITESKVKMILDAIKAGRVAKQG
ncbi:MAG TPA: hypothetical protein VE621_02840 [Bryobacteraceae bacterium]|nr:hypothetical protein [Bryobacteraceae bacterium]